MRVATKAINGADKVIMPATTGSAGISSRRRADRPFECIENIATAGTNIVHNKVQK